MSIADLLDDWFESPQIKGALAVNGVIGTWAGPYEPGTAYVMAHHSIGDVGDGRLGSWGFPEGGMGAVADAIAGAARLARRDDQDRRPGRQGRRRPRHRPGHRRRARQRRGDHARRSSSPRCTRRPRSSTTSGEENLPADFAADIEHWKTRSGVVKINLALGRAARLHRQPRHQPAGAPHRLGRDGALDGVHRARVHRRPRGPPGRPAVLRRRDPDHVRPDALPRGHAHHVAVHPVGAGRLEPASRTATSWRSTPTG